MSYLVEKSHTLEELIAFGLGKFEVSNDTYLVDIIKTNHLFYSTNRNALKDLLHSVIKHKPTADSFLDWLEATVPVYLKEGESFYKTYPEITLRTDLKILEYKVNELEKRIEVIYDLLEELAKKV